MKKVENRYIGIPHHWNKAQEDRPTVFADKLAIMPSSVAFSAIEEEFDIVFA